MKASPNPRKLMEKSSSPMGPSPNAMLSGGEKLAGFALYQANQKV